MLWAVLAVLQLVLKRSRWRSIKHESWLCFIPPTLTICTIQLRVYDSFIEAFVCLHQENYGSEIHVALKRTACSSSYAKLCLVLVDSLYL